MTGLLNLAAESHVDRSIDNPGDSVTTNIMGTANLIEVSGQQIRDWIHVEDCALGLISIFENGSSGKIYHLGANDEHTNLDIARTLLKQLGKSESLIAHVPDRLGHDARYALDTRSTLEAIGWSARIPFRLGFEKAVLELRTQLS